MLDKPVIRGTRVSVELILRELAEGPEAELPEDYPHLTTEDIRAAVAYGAASVAHEEVVLLPDAPGSGYSRIMKFVAQSREAGRHRIAQRFSAGSRSPQNSESLQGRHNPRPDRIDVTRF